MQISQDFRTLVAGVPTAVTIGNFDGVHRGHQALLRRIAAWRDAHPGSRAAVLTFDPHPVRVIAPALAPPLVCVRADKRRLLEREGVDMILEQSFDRAFAALAPETFVADVVTGALGARLVVVGYDFTFGARRAGTVDTLRALGAVHGFEVDVVPPQVVGDGLVASSSKVREFVLEGRVDGAALVLGRPFHLSGTVVTGDRRGRQLGFPTANLRPENELLPRSGIYAGWLDWGESPRPAAISVGLNPTFGAESLRVEAHVLDAPAGLDLYDRRCHLYFVARLRDEQRFDGVDALVDQIRRDCDSARAALGAPPRSLLGALD
jgi:riboflavin kinase/FMN adenylyltransferase